MSFFRATPGRGNRQIIDELKEGLGRLVPGIVGQMVTGPTVTPPRAWDPRSFGEMILGHGVSAIPFPQPMEFRFGLFMNQLLEITQSTADDAHADFHAVHRHVQIPHAGHQQRLDGVFLDQHNVRLWEATTSSVWGSEYNMQLANLINIAVNWSKILRRAREFIEEIQQADEKEEEAYEACREADKQLISANNSGDRASISIAKRLVRSTTNAKNMAVMIANRKQFNYAVQTKLGVNIVGYSYSLTRDGVLTRNDCNGAKLVIVSFGEDREPGFKTSYPTTDVSLSTRRRTALQIHVDALEGGIYSRTILVPFPLDYNTNEMAYWNKMLTLYHTQNEPNPIRLMFDTLLEAIIANDNYGNPPPPRQFPRPLGYVATPEDMVEGWDVYQLQGYIYDKQFELSRKRLYATTPEIAIVSAALTRFEENVRQIRERRRTAGRNLVNKITTECRHTCVNVLWNYCLARIRTMRCNI